MVMALNKPDSPTALTDAVLASVKTLAAIAQPRLPGLSEAADLTLTDPVNVYYLVSAQLAGRLPSITAIRRGWSYIVRSKNDAVALADTIVPKSNGPEPDKPPHDNGEVFASLGVGPFVSGTVAALEAAQSLPAVQAADFTLAALQVPVVYALAVWLKSRDGAGDLVVPVAPAPAGIKANEQYAISDYLKVLAALEVARKKAPDVFPPPPA